MNTLSKFTSYLFCTLLTLVFFTGCSDDDSQAEETSYEAGLKFYELFVLVLDGMTKNQSFPSISVPGCFLI